MDNVPILVDEEATQPLPRMTMVELVFGDEPENEEALWNEGPRSLAEDR